jgi:hypothetical protein
MTKRTSCHSTMPSHMHAHCPMVDNSNTTAMHPRRHGAAERTSHHCWSSAQRTIVDHWSFFIKKGIGSLVTFHKWNLWAKSDEEWDNRNGSIKRKPLNPRSFSSLCLLYLSPTGMVTFGGIHFNLFSLGKQDSTMVISARKNRSWHEREQVRHIFLTPIPRT